MLIYPDMLFRKVLGPKEHVNPTWFALAEPVQFTFRNQTFEMNAGFTTDFSSVPRILWSFIPPHGQSARASVKHDFLYDKHQKLGIGDDEKTRLLVDMIFYRDLIQDGVPRWQSRLMYKAVRKFGKRYWKD